MERKTLVKLLIGCFFVGLLLVPAGLRQLEAFRAADLLEDREQTLQRYGFYLEEITEEAGVDFVHRRPVVDERLHHILPQISSVGASVAVADFNEDGAPDFYLTNSDFGTANALYMNDGRGNFTDVAGELGIARLNDEARGVSMGSVWGDVDNDGYEDLLIYRWGRLSLFRNEGGRGFTDITEGSGLDAAGWMNANTAVWLDYNGDGRLDLFVGGYFHERVDFWDLEDTRIMPDSYEYATNGGRNYLFENQGDGTFREVAEETGLLETRRWTLAAAAADISGTGYPDLVLANDYGVDELFINENGRGFVNMGESTGMGFIPKSGMSASFGDVLNQGQHGIYISNISEAGVLMQGNNLWVPTRRSGQGRDIKFRNIAGNMGIEIGQWGYGGRFTDFNNDGNIDLYLANGYVSDAPDTDYWYDYAKVVGGNRSIITDARNWPDMEGRTFSGYQANKIWMNDGAGRFREVAAAVGGELRLDSRSVAHADIDGNGSLDLIVASQHGPVTLYRNTVRSAHNWIAFGLEGKTSNRSAIGADIILHWEGKKHVKTVHAGDAFSSQSQRVLHFGLGEAENVERAEIRWPSGQTQTLEAPELNRLHKITERMPS
ncbi:MAG: CRTAC1 family protein [Cyclonatronaceae bacterium]